MTLRPFRSCTIQYGKKEMGNSCKSVFPNTRAWEQQEWNMIKKQTKKASEAWFLIRWFSTATSGTKPIKVSAMHVYILLHQRDKWGSTIQYGYRKRGTHARAFSQTLTHGNSKNEIRHETDEDTQKRGVSMEKSTAGTNKRSPDSLSHPNRNTIIINKIW